MRKFIRKRIIFMIIYFVFIVVLKINSVEAAYTTYDIDNIDTTKYPGYKEQLQSIKAQYPNWKIKLLYTGLDWNYVIENERTGHGNIPKSLIHDTYDAAWICQETECLNKKYDVSQRWNCASKQAIEYMMDPRNSLDANYIFQFQDLGSPAGERTEIDKMVEKTFLANASCVDAILYASKEYNISPFHLVSRIIQEQGTAGIGNMNGYIYNGQIVYNLFNIRVSGNSSEGFLAGAEFAYNQGWFTREASIVGGAKFLRQNYLDRGQSTLYFQKYNVVDTNNLFEHQYMQNIRAANDEGNNIYKTYKSSEILDSHFEFCIPMYENMPAIACPRPYFVQANDITFETEKYVINIDEAIDVPYTLIPGNSTFAQFEWTSSDPEVLRVWYNRFRGLKEGTAEMIVKTTDGRIEKRIKVVVRNPNKSYVQDITFERSQYVINIDEAIDLPFKYTPTDSVNAEFEWSSSNPEILRVWNNRFRGLKEGTAYVIARTIDGTVERWLKVIIRDPNKSYVEDIQFEKTEYVVDINEAVDFGYTYTPKDSVNAEFEWSSSNPDIIRVCGNRFRGLKEGTAYVIVRTTDGTIERKLKVEVKDYSKAKVEEIIVDKSEYAVYIDEAIDISYSCYPSYATNTELEWSSSNPEILRVWHNRFRALAEGTAEVIARTMDGTVEKRIKVRIKNPDKVYIENIEFEQTEYTVDIDEAMNLPFTYLPANSENAEFIWSSSNPEILRVSGNRFRGLKEGTAEVIVQTTDGLFEQHLTINVKNLNKPYVEEVELEKEEYTIYIDEAVDLPYTYTPTNSKNAEFVWSSSNSEILRVCNNRFRGLKEGTAEVIVKTFDGKYEKRITVKIKDPNKVYIENIEFEQEEYTVDLDEAINLPFTYAPANSENAEFIWSSSNPEILRVSGNRFRGLKEGTAEVIVQTTDGMFEKRIKVTVKNLNKSYVQEVKIEKEEYIVDVDEAVDLPYTYTPANSKNAEFVWSSSNPEILRVWNNRFRGLKEGTADVIVKTFDGKYEKRIKVTVKNVS